jgi:hypothetical protein
VIFTNAALIKKFELSCFEILFPLTRNVAWISDVELLGHESAEVADVVEGN